jgi:D-amino-acid dehydrogenase
MYDVALVGGGIIGTACALELLAAGRSVVTIEAGDPGAGTAAGSAGYLSDGEIFPLAQPAAVRALPSLAFDPESPLVIAPAAWPGLIGWGTRFLLAARPGRVRAGMRALASLNRLANDALYAMALRSKAARYLRREGALHVARSRRVFAHAASLVPILEEHGLTARVVERERLLQLEPSLSHDVSGAVEYPNSMRCTDPGAFGTALALDAVARGAIVLRARARALQAAGAAWRITTDGSPVEARSVVVTAGVWSRPLLRRLGYTVPMQAARGYHLMLPQPGASPQRTLLFEDAHFCATPMDGGLRLAGTVEFAPLGAPPNFVRADVLYGAAAAYLPNLRRDGATRWMGNRPSFPDSLPAIGASRHTGLYYCFGHEKLGLTQAAVSAQAVAALVTGADPPVDLAPFSLQRFL